MVPFLPILFVHDSSYRPNPYCGRCFLPALSPGRRKRTVFFPASAGERSILMASPGGGYIFLGTPHWAARQILAQNQSDRKRLPYGVSFLVLCLSV